jgi:hypothetical protein
MKVQEILLEFLEPRKPDTVKSSTFKKRGAQSSVTNIVQRQFTTSHQNVVKVQFSPAVTDNDEKSVSITFYVNDVLYDNASTTDKDIKNDFEILSGVMYIVLNYLDRAKLNHCTFDAFKGEGDTKTKFNMPLDKAINNLNGIIDSLYQKLADLDITPEMVQNELNRVNALYAKLRKPLVDTVIVIYKPELMHALKELKQFLAMPPTEHSANQFGLLTMAISKYDKNMSTWPEYKALVDSINNIRPAIVSYGKQGASITKNRRFSVYSRILDKYFSNKWDVQTQHESFYLTRKGTK